MRGADVVRLVPCCSLAEIILADCGAISECGVHRVDNALCLWTARI